MMALNVMFYLIETLLDHRFVRFPTGSHKLCALGLNHVKLLLQSFYLLFKSLLKL